MKTKLTHKTETGHIATRTTHRPYTHVVVVEDNYPGFSNQRPYTDRKTGETIPAGTWHANETFGHLTVVRWSESFKNAAKFAGSEPGLKVEVINNGEREDVRAPKAAPEAPAAVEVETAPIADCYTISAAEVVAAAETDDRPVIEYLKVPAVQRVQNAIEKIRKLGARVTVFDPNQYRDSYLVRIRKNGVAQDATIETLEEVAATLELLINMNA